MAFDKSKFLVEAEKLAGLPYCWPTKENNYSGKGFDWSIYPDSRDCSGLVTSSIKAAGGKDIRGTHNAQKLCDMLKDTKTPEAGDLVFYGYGRNMVTHVMIYWGDGRVFGASGGNSHTTSPELAKKAGAMVRFRSKPDYRPDVLCVKRLVL